RAVNIWFAGEHAGVVYQVARGKIVRAVDDHVIVDEQPQRVLAGQTGLVSFDLDVRIDVLETILRRSDLGAPDVLGAVNELSMQVRCVDHIEINQTEPANTGRREIHSQRRA